MIDYLSSFPAGFKPNTQQDFILKEVAKARSNNLKYVVINASTGSGKSFISKTLANSLPKPSQGWENFVESGALYDLEEDEIDSSHQVGTSVLTMTKSLQDQYFNLFNDSSVLKGKNNYPCSMSSTLPCDMGPCVTDENQRDLCISCKQCEYFNNRDECASSQCSFYSYSMFLSLPVGCRAKEILVCDEAAELENILVNTYTIPINFKLISKLGVSIPATPVKGAPYEKYLLWLRSVKSEIYSKVNVLRSQFRSKNASKVKKEDKLKYRALSVLNDSCDTILDAMEHNEFIIEHSKEELIFKPYKIDKLAQKMFKHSKFIVLMSATIIDHINFTKQLGIKENEYLYIESPSTFNAAKAPIKLSNKIGVSYANKELVIPKLALVAKQICDLHKDQKGIIHSHTMSITADLKKILGNNPRFLFREVGVTNAEIVRRHSESSEPTILVSPSLSHGIDLIGDLGEFAIVMKAPFLPLSDLRVKKMFDNDPVWYLDQCLASFIQSIGRTIRSKDDTSITYVLDAVLTKTLVQNQNKLPKYIINRFC